jgi:hypothetical protein
MLTMAERVAHPLAAGVAGTPQALPQECLRGLITAVEMQRFS